MRIIVFKNDARRTSTTKLRNCLIEDRYNEINFSVPGMKLDKRIEEAVPAGQQLQELGMRLRCLDDGSSDQVSLSPHR